nr:HPr family phosphocarrier protein [Roseospira goensis]
MRSADDGGAGTAAAVTADCEIVNQRGLHARAAARFVKTVERYDASVKVFSRGQEVSGHSIMGLMMLAAGRGSTIHVVCEGREAGAVMEALQTLIAARFDED